jgi:hypothetical protein
VSLQGRVALVRVVAIATVALCLIAIGLDLAASSSSGGLFFLYTAIIVPFAVIGWLISERKPGNAIGPLLIAFALLFALFLPADLYLRLGDDLPGASFAVLYASSLDAPSLVLIALVLILFPDGSPPTPRWRPILWLAAPSVILVVAGFVLAPGPNFLYPDYESPVGIDGIRWDVAVYLGYAGMLVVLVAAAGSLIVRWRRGGVVERAQIKWVAAAAVLLVVTEIVNVATFDPTKLNAATVIVASLGIATIPIAIGIAVLRYRLYEIDRIISRTLGWAIVTGLLVAVFALLVVGLQAILAGVTQGQTLAVAASTLVAATLFQPVRRRVQHAVDHRFDRARYDAERTATAFAERLRDETDIATVTGDLAATAGATLAPASLSIWLRRP